MLAARLLKVACGRALCGLSRFVRKQPLGAAGGLILFLMVIAAVAAPVVSTHDPLQTAVSERLQSPNADHLMGTDEIGRDIFSRIVYGSRVSLYVGILTVLLSMTVGTAIGISSGYLGGKYDLVMQRLLDALMAFPPLVLALAVMAALGAGMNNVVVAIALASMPGFARIVRGSTMSIKTEMYVEAAKAIGCGNLRIGLRHILPNVAAPIIIIATASLGGIILTEAGLSFLGVGVPPPAPSWGGMLTGGARKYMEAAPWLAIFPGLAITLVVLAFNLFGDALRDALDPRLRGST